MELAIPFSSGDLLVGCSTCAAVLLWALTLPLRSGVREGSVICAAAVAKLIACIIFCLLNVYYFSEGSDAMGYHLMGVYYSDMISNDLASGTLDYLTTQPFYSMGTATSSYRCWNLSGLIHFLTFKSFFGSSVVFAMLGFAGQVLLYRVFVSRYPDPRIRTWWRAGILFLPSLVFWSAGMLKDPLGILGLGCAFYGINQMLVDGFPRGLLKTLFGVYTLVLFRMQVLAVLLMALLPLILSLRSSRSSQTPAHVAFLVAARCLILGAVFYLFFHIGQLESRLSLSELPSSVAVHSSNFGQKYTEAGAVKLEKDASLSSALFAIPSSIIFTLFQPFPWEVRGPMMAFASLENLALLFLTARSVFHCMRRPAVVSELCRDMFFVGCILFVIAMAIMLGLSTPNFGTISRYRMPLIPFAVGVLAITEYRYRLLTAPAGHVSYGERRSWVAAPARIGS